MWGFPKMGMPKTIGFNTKTVQFEMIWGYPHFRKPPCVCIYIWVILYSYIFHLLTGMHIQLQTLTRMKQIPSGYLT